MRVRSNSSSYLVGQLEMQFIMYSLDLRVSYLASFTAHNGPKEALNFA